MKRHDHEWYLTEAFNKFGFGDGDGCIHTDEVREALAEADPGWALDSSSGGLHNDYICGAVQLTDDDERTEVPGTEVLFSGIDLPDWDSLPETFRDVLLKLDPEVETDWRRKESF